MSEEKIEIRFEGAKGYYQINSVGADSKTSMMGEFSFKAFLSPLDIINADKTYRDLIGAINPHLASQDATTMAFALSQLKVRTIDSPEWFKQKPINGSHLDKNILVELVNASYEVEVQYAKNQNARIKKTEKALKKAISSKKIERQPEEEETPLSEDQE